MHTINFDPSTRCTARVKFLYAHFQCELDQHGKSEHYNRQYGEWK